MVVCFFLLYLDDCFRSVTGFNFVCTMLLLCDILSTVNRLSTSFQQRELDFSVDASAIKATLPTIEARQSKDGPALAGISSYMDKMSVAGIAINLPKLGTRGHKVEASSRDIAMQRFNKTEKTSFLRALADNVEKGCEDDDIFKYFNVYSSILKRCCL